MAQPAAPISRYRKAGNLLFTSGQVYLTKEGILLEGTVEEKTHQIMKNLQEILTEAGATFGDVVKTTIYVTDMANYGEINQVYASYFKENYPAREVVQVSALPLGATVEISMVAAIR